MALCVLVADQLTKSAINNTLLPGRLLWPVHGGGLFGLSWPHAVIFRSQRLHVLPGIELVNLHNPDMILGGYLPGPPLAVMIAMCVLVLIPLSRFYRTNARVPLIWLWIGLLIGGGLGNLLSLIREGSVTDFLRLSWLGPIMNLADAAVIGGLLMLVLFHRRTKRAGERRRVSLELSEPAQSG